MNLRLISVRAKNILILSFLPSTVFLNSVNNQINGDRLNGEDESLIHEHGEYLGVEISKTMKQLWVSNIYLVKGESGGTAY